LRVALGGRRFAAHTGLTVIHVARPAKVAHNRRMSALQQTMRAVLTTGDAQNPVAVGQTPVPNAQPGEALVRVQAVSLNPGELRRARKRAAREPIGWDFAGVVEAAAADGTGPKAGARVVGFVANGAWADYVAAPAAQIGTLPGAVSFADAATLPIAGLTALRTLRRGSDLRGKSVLVVPGTGGVGLFAVQLAKRAGGRVTAVVRSASSAALVRRLGADAVVVGPTSAAAAHGPYDHIVESLGGESLGAALAMVAADGTVVSFGQTAGTTTTFAADAFYATGGATLYGFIIFHEARKDPVTRDLEQLAALVAAGELATSIDATLPFDEFTAAISARDDRKLSGKVIVTLA
jgi:NADPH2:quinone reductase